ncbi:hypothetical protein BDP27DRAFT_1429406 [Rhodocollybia butyracea]|uniref:Uncharacterized protein n=1 Tax=Rhodocollybia butyracea TaxID=206335 RepID=A0A9P5PCY4_9AGAR|nr:hypothetical protein BDP27DRAFT_1429406 [Rhodocollybia butyracea]
MDTVLSHLITQNINSGQLTPAMLVQITAASSNTTLSLPPTQPLLAPIVLPAQLSSSSGPAFTLAAPATLASTIPSIPVPLPIASPISHTPISAASLPAVSTPYQSMHLLQSVAQPCRYLWIGRFASASVYKTPTDSYELES